MLDYKKLISDSHGDPKNLTIDDMALVYGVVAELYNTEVPKELLFEGERWYKDTMGIIEEIRDDYKQTYDGNWKVALCECPTNMFGSQDTISKPKLDRFKHVLKLPKIDYTIVPPPAGIHPTAMGPKYRGSMNRVGYDAHTRLRSFVDEGIRKTSTFLFLPTNGIEFDEVAFKRAGGVHRSRDQYEEHHLQAQYKNGILKPKRISELPLADWDNNGHNHNRAMANPC